MLERLPLLYLCHGSAAEGRTATRARRLVKTLVCARAQCRTVTGRAGLGRPGKAMGRVRYTNRPRAALWTWATPLLCDWAVRGFGPVTVELIFYFLNIFNSLQIEKIV
jgi:hypothetical protein